jgi:hypothetical protein
MVGQTPHSIGLARADDLHRVYIKCLDKFKNGFTITKQVTKFLQTQAGTYGCLIQDVHKMLGQIQERVHHINNKEQGSYKHRPECTGMFYTGSTKHKWTNPTFSTSKQNKNFIQTQSENEWFFS